MKILVVALSGLIFTACSSNSSKYDGSGDPEPDKVLARIDNLKERPSWLKESEIFQVEKGSVAILGKQTIGGDQNIEQAFRSAELNAKGEIAKAIEQKVQVVFQNAEEGNEYSANQARFMGIIATDVMKTSSVRTAKRYWEKYRTSLDSGERVTKIDAFILVQMSEADFKKAIFEAIKKREGKGGISLDFSKKVDQQWDNIMAQDISDQSNKSDN